MYGTDPDRLTPDIVAIKISGCVNEEFRWSE